MNKEPQDIDQILPYGEMLRGFMEQSFIGKNDLKDVLRNRGVFTHNNEKHNTIPILSSTVLSPSEFDYLRECQNSKEDNPKIITQTIEWQSEDTLFESIPENFDVSSVMNLEFSNFRVVGNPSFVPIEGNPDCIRMDFSIERDDMSKNWATNKSIFPGSLELKRVSEGSDIQVVITHTANETKNVASKTSSSLVKYFKEQGFVNQSKNLEKILFSKFSNSKRIIYLLSLTQECRSSILEFIDIVDVEFSPDSNSKLPKDIKWMEKKIEDLKLNGNALHETLFFSNVDYYDYLHLYKVDAKFKFHTSGLSGNCVFSLGFPDYGHDKNIQAEMEVNIKALSFDIHPKGINKSEIKQILLKEIESQKISSFQYYRIDRNTPEEIPEILDPNEDSQAVAIASHN
jgi:hypothetical protein